jgi:CNT family concentrative nucleoside transporter
LVGFALIYSGLFLFSGNHSAVQARTTILGIGFQFIVGLFVFRTGAGYSFFGWIATAAADLLTQADIGGATFFWSTDFVAEHYFFVNTLSSIIFFVALVIFLSYLGVLQWSVKKAAWLFHKSFDISGAEAVVAVASPFIGQGENVVLVRPYAALFTRSEFHQVLTSGFATIAGSVLAFYISLGIPGPILVSSSVMSIPASIAASKIIYPETQECVTKGTLVVDRQELPEDKAYGMLHALSKGAWFGVVVAASIFCNVLVILSLVYTINGILAYIGNAWYITDTNGGPLSLELIFSYLLWPLTFMLGVPGHETLAVSRLIATKIVANEVSLFSRCIF